MIVYIDMDDVICDYSGAYNRAIELTPSIAFPQSQYGFYTALQPIKGAIPAIKNLMASDNIKPYILSAPSIRNPLSYTEKRIWIETYFGLEFTERLILSPDKGLLKGDILIDDRISGHGQESFDGNLIQFGSVDWPDWYVISSYLKSLKVNS